MGSLLLVRHAQASFGMGDYDRLSATGIEQARILGRRLIAPGTTGTPLRCAVSGDLRRHRDTARIALHGLLASYDIDADWNEYDHVDVLSAYRPRWANQMLMKSEMAATLRPRRSFQTEFANAIARWTGGERDGDYRETWPAFRSRVLCALDRLHARMAPKQHAVVFTSGGPITVILQQLTGLSAAQAFHLNWTLANASITKLLVTRGGLRLSSFNDHAHFEHAPDTLITYR